MVAGWRESSSSGQNRLGNIIEQHVYTLCTVPGGHGVQYTVPGGHGGRVAGIKFFRTEQVWKHHKSCTKNRTTSVYCTVPVLHIDKWASTKEYVHLEGKRGGPEEGVTSSLKLNITDPCRTVLSQYHGCGLGHLSQYTVCASTMPRAQNRAEKGSILL